jgi:L-lactate dehydrogenase (cytochrome)
LRKATVPAALHPGWWFNLLTTEPLTFASLTSWNGTIAELVNQMFDPAVTFDDLAWLREQWRGDLIVKGILNVDDARAGAPSTSERSSSSARSGCRPPRGPDPMVLSKSCGW